MATYEIDLKILDEKYKHLVNINLDVAAQAKVATSGESFEHAMHTLKLATLSLLACSGAAACLQMVGDFTLIFQSSINVADESFLNNVTEFFRNDYLKYAAAAGVSTGMITGMTLLSKKLADKFDSFMNNLKPSLEEERVDALVKAYGECYDLIWESDTKQDGWKAIQSAYEAIRPLAESLDFKSQLEKDTIYYGWMQQYLCETKKWDLSDESYVPTIDQFPKSKFE
ncbi:MAG: hypothetical protein HAW67_07000 [Endozoicomonadaceae bacterium]|nr:hypothetical protein [Endozoicomonadaceae bacterium]